MPKVKCHHIIREVFVISGCVQAQADVTSILIILWSCKKIIESLYKTAWVKELSKQLYTLNGFFSTLCLIQSWKSWDIYMWYITKRSFQYGRVGYLTLTYNKDIEDYFVYILKEVIMDYFVIILNEILLKEYFVLFSGYLTTISYYLLKRILWSYLTHLY